MAGSRMSAKLLSSRQYSFSLVILFPSMASAACVIAKQERLASFSTRWAICDAAVYPPLTYVSDLLIDVHKSTSRLRASTESSGLTPPVTDTTVAHGHLLVHLSGASASIKRYEKSMRAMSLALGGKFMYTKSYVVFQETVVLSLVLVNGVMAMFFKLPECISQWCTPTFCIWMATSAMPIISRDPIGMVSPVGSFCIFSRPLLCR
mmetsp:Transcript_35651/g.88694  ORF Transcript_35651/g.88694 Transcript_35651/m.88694 type:complete len:206 (+) Transcript_35651:1319-1936(+)